MSRTLTALVALAAGSAPAADPDAKTVLAAHIANLDSFTRFTVRHEMTAGNAFTPTDALAGRLKDVETATAVWARDGAAESLKVTTNGPPPKPPKKDELVPVPGFPGLVGGQGSAYRTSSYLASRTRTLAYTPEFRSATLDGTGLPRDVDGRVWDTGVMAHHPSPPRWAVARGAPAKAVADSLDGIQMVKVVFDWSGMAVECYFDPARGHLLRRQTITQVAGPTAGTQDITEWLEPREVKPGRWLPSRVHERFKQPAMAHWIVREMRVTALTVDDRPARADLTLNMPAKHRVQDHAESLRLFYLRNDESVHVDDLDRLWDTLETVVKEKELAKAASRRLPDTRIVRSRPWWVYVGWAIAGVTAVGLAGRLWRRRAAGVD